MSDMIDDDKYDAIPLPQPRKRDLFFTKQVDQDSIAELAENIVAIERHDEYIAKLYALHDLEYKPKEINIFIDSYGGMVYQGFGLLSIMRECKTPIHTIVTGTAMSCGFLIAITGHRRSCYADSTYMYHQISSDVSGTLKAIEDEYIEVSRLQARMEEMTLRKTKLTKQQLKDVYRTHTDLYLTAEQALASGCVDHIIGQPVAVPVKKRAVRKVIDK